MMKTIVLAAVLVFNAQAHAQTASTPAKKDLVAKIMKLQQPAVEVLARQIVEQPAAQMMQRAGQYLQAKVAPDQREAIARDVQAEARKYVEDTFPFVRERALKLAPSTIGTLIEEKMTEDELRQVLAMLESAAWKKFQGLAPEMQRSLGEKLVQEVKSHVEPRIRALDQAMIKRMGISAPASGADTGK